VCVQRPSLFLDFDWCFALANLDMVVTLVVVACCLCDVCSIFLSLSSDVSPVFGLVRIRVVVTAVGVNVSCSFCLFVRVWFFFDAWIALALLLSWLCGSCDVLLWVLFLVCFFRGCLWFVFVSSGIDDESVCLGSLVLCDFCFVLSLFCSPLFSSHPVAVCAFPLLSSASSAHRLCMLCGHI
jgi:hypothetical protein